jgi:hypothetical protein
MIARLVRYALTYPLWFYCALGIGWSYGLTGLLRAAGPSHGTPSAPGLAMTAATLACTQLLFRAVDDVRDLGYDRRQNPQRPLVTGAVRSSDLMLLFFVGMGVLVTLNARRGLPGAGYGAACGYACLILFTEWRLNWPDPEQMLLQLLVNIPLQFLFGVYVYLGLNGSVHFWPGLRDAAAIAGFVLCLSHLEIARRLVRHPKRETRTYVHTLGVSGTAWTALVCAVSAVALELAATRPWSPLGRESGWLVLAALPVPLVAAGRFFRGAPRWPLRLAVLYVLLSFAAFVTIGFQR